jgi:hypothetical protein
MVSCSRSCACTDNPGLRNLLIGLVEAGTELVAIA